MLDAHLRRREESDRAVSILAGGAAFELWLAFESRILVDAPEGRARLALDSPARNLAEHPERYWTGNEVEKFDLYIGDCDTDDCVLAVEYKLIHNNKNWRYKVDEVWEDLFRDRQHAKYRHRPKVRSIVGVVGKTYPAASRGDYPGQRDDLLAWEAELWEYALSDYQGSRMARVWSGERLKLDPRVSRWLDASHGQHWFQLHLLCDESMAGAADGA